MAKFVKASSSNVIRFFEQSVAPTILDGVTLGDMWVDLAGTPNLKICTSISPVTFVAAGAGSGSLAPSDAQYVVLAANGTLTNESVLAVGSSKLTLSGSTLDVDQTALSIASTQVTGTKTSSYISDFTSAASAAAPVQSVNGATGTVSLSTTNIAEGTSLYYTDERVDDRVSSLIQNGTGITWSYNDESNTLTPAVSITQYSDELAQDAIGGILTDTASIDFTYNDATPSITADIKTGSVTNDMLAGSIASSKLANAAVANLSGTNTGDQTITLTGDVTGSGTGSFAATISNDAVTYSKIQDVSATDRILGRSSVGAGNVEEIVCTSAGRALLDDATAADQRTTLGLGTLATQSGTFSGTSSGTNTGDQTLPNVFNTIVVSGQSDVVADSTADTLTLVAGTNVTITTNAGTDTITIAASGGGGNSFETIAVAGQSNVVADSSTDTLTLIAGSNITLTTNATNDSVTITAAGGAASISQTEVDFGTTPVSEGTFTITDAGVTPSSQIIATVAYEAPTDKDLDECTMDQLNIMCAPASGSFDMFITACDGSYLADKFKINYLVG